VLAGATPWPLEFARRYRERGWWQDITLGAMLAQTAARLPAKTALVHGDRRISYGRLLADAEALATRLLEAGLVPLDRVVLQLPNIPEFVVTYFALVRIGCIPVMALRAHRHTEVGHFLRASAAVAYIIPDVINGFDYRVMAEQLHDDAPALRMVLVFGEPLPGQISLSEMLAQPAASAGLQAMAVTGPDPDEVATMLLSGGTTALSKLIPRTHNDYVANARLCGAAAGFSEDTVFMAILPLGHNYNLASPGLLGTFYYGGTVVLARSGEAGVVFGLVEKEAVSVIAAVVPLISDWLNSDLPRKFDLSSLKVIQNGGARLAPELRSRLRQTFGCTPQEIYGTAEGLISMTRLDDSDDLLLNSSGRPVCADDEIRVVDEEGRSLPDGASGELLVRGPYTIRGYYDAAMINPVAFTEDGYYRMGDVVRKFGRTIYTEGRKKDLINRGGEKISCEEIENLIVAHPKVKAVTLVAMPDQKFGEKACAFVILRAGETLGFDELIAFLKRQQIASFKLPERLELVAEFPLSPVGKILKRKLREMIADRLSVEGDAA